MNPPDIATPVTGPAYGRGMKIMATALVAGLALLTLRVLWRTDGWAGSDAGWLLGLSGVAIAVSWWQMLTSTTTVDAQGIRQSGWVDKSMRWDEVAATRLLSPHLAPRLVVKARFGRPRAFYAGNAELAAVFRLIASRKA